MSILAAILAGVWAIAATATQHDSASIAAAAFLLLILNSLADLLPLFSRGLFAAFDALPWSKRSNASVAASETAEDNARAGH